MYLSPLSLATLLIGITAYYYIFNYVNAASFFMLTASIYLVYALITTSSLLLTAGVYSLRMLLRRRANAVAAAPASVATSAFGSIMSCGCHYSLFASFLAYTGLSASEIGIIEHLDFFYSNYFVGTFIAVNIVLLLYQCGRKTHTVYGWEDVTQSEESGRHNCFSLRNMAGKRAAGFGNWM